MGLYKSIKKRIDWARYVQFDSRTGFYRYKRFGKYVYIRHPRHFLDQTSNEWVCENIIFNQYRPVNGDVVVDLGAGYGEEALYVAQFARLEKYIGVEAQPVIYECLANTFHSAGKEFIASPYVITDRSFVKFFSKFSYASVGEVPGADDSYIEVPTQTWADFLARYEISNIDLLKMNIEGAEKEVLEQITDYSIIKRLVISCHDFMAENNEGEWYRTKAAVTAILQQQGYHIHYFKSDINWANDWIYAQRV